MKYNRLFKAVTAVFSAAVFFLVIPGPLSIQAADEQFPHLIQTVTQQDILEGMLALGFLESTVLETADCDTAYENIKDCIVQIHMEGAYGSGIVWEMTPEQVIIVTNKHVLEYWRDSASYVRFAKGYIAKAEILGMSEESDIGFLVVDNQELDYTELEKIRYAHHDAEAYQLLQAGDKIFWAGADDVVSAESIANFYQGSVGDMRRYIEEFEGYMVYAYGYAREGMSGGGTFDAKGNLIGILSAATAGGETASVPLPLIVEAYEEIVAKAQAGH